MENQPPPVVPNENPSQPPPAPISVSPPPQLESKKISFRLPLGHILVALAIIGIALLFGSGGFLVYHDASQNSQAQPSLQPSGIGNGQCQASILSNGSVYAQINVKGVDCNWVPAVAEGAAKAGGKTYTTFGWLCDSVKKSNEPSAWSGTHYAYSCINGSGQLAFNWGNANDYIYSESSSSSPPSGSSSSSVGSNGYLPPVTPNQYVSGALQPTQVNDGECYAYTLSNNYLYAQVAVTSGSLCNDVQSVAQGAVSANSGNYTADGYSCTATPESSSNAEWSSYWTTNFIDYSCADGSNQIAFNYGNVNDSGYY